MNAATALPNRPRGSAEACTTAGLVCATTISPAEFNIPNAISNTQGSYSHSPYTNRIILHDSPCARVENCWTPSFAPTWRRCESDYRIALTYSGIFSYAVDEHRWLIDTCRALFITPGRESLEEHPVKGIGHAALIISPSKSLLAELSFQREDLLNSAFAAASCPSTMRLRLLTQHILHLGPDSECPLHKDECVIHILEQALQLPGPSRRRGSKLVDQTRQLLHARFGQRLLLEQIAGEIGASPAYLTQEFTRCEGIPLYQYQLQLRLSRALIDLPHCNDITGLALDLGFSSHSHFTYVFRKAFGLTPSDYRSSIGSRQLLAKNRIRLDEERRRASS